MIAVAKNIDLKMRGTDVKGLLIDNMLGILMPGTNAEGAVTVVEKLHLFLTVVAVELEDGKKNIKVKPSIGAASFQESDIDVIVYFNGCNLADTFLSCIFNCWWIQAFFENNA